MFSVTPWGQALSLSLTPCSKHDGSIGRLEPQINIRCDFFFLASSSIWKSKKGLGGHCGENLVARPDLKESVVAFYLACRSQDTCHAGVDRQLDLSAEWRGTLCKGLEWR